MIKLYSIEMKVPNIGLLFRQKSGEYTSQNLIFQDENHLLTEFPKGFDLNITTSILKINRKR